MFFRRLYNYFMIFVYLLIWLGPSCVRGLSYDWFMDAALVRNSVSMNADGSHFNAWILLTLVASLVDQRPLALTELWQTWSLSTARLFVAWNFFLARLSDTFYSWIVLVFLWHLRVNDGWPGVETCGALPPFSLTRGNCHSWFVYWAHDWWKRLLVDRALLLILCIWSYSQVERPYLFNHQVVLAHWLSLDLHKLQELLVLWLVLLGRVSLTSWVDPGYLQPRMGIYEGLVPTRYSNFLRSLNKLMRFCSRQSLWIGPWVLQNPVGRWRWNLNLTERRFLGSWHFLELTISGSGLRIYVTVASLIWSLTELSHPALPLRRVIFLEDLAPLRSCELEVRLLVQLIVVHFRWDRPLVFISKPIELTERVLPRIELDLTWLKLVLRFHSGSLWQLGNRCLKQLVNVLHVDLFADWERVRAADLSL